MIKQEETECEDREENTRELQEQISDYIQEHPKRCIIVAAVVGLVVGCIMGKLLRR